MVGGFMISDELMCTEPLEKGWRRAMKKEKYRFPGSAAFPGAGMNPGNGAILEDTGSNDSHLLNLLCTHSSCGILESKSQLCWILKAVSDIPLPLRSATAVFRTDSFSANAVVGSIAKVEDPAVDSMPAFSSWLWKGVI